MKAQLVFWVGECVCHSILANLIANQDPSNHCVLRQGFEVEIDPVFQDLGSDLGLLKAIRGCVWAVEQPERTSIVHMPPLQMLMHSFLRPLMVKWFGPQLMLHELS